MEEQKQQTRVNAFIDVGWLLDGVRGQGLDWRLDYSALVERIAGGQTVARKFAYLAPYPAEYYPKKAVAHGELMDLMAAQGFDTRTADMQVRGGMYLDLGIDVLLTVDMMEQASLDNFDTAIIVSRRTTLVPAINAVKQLDKKVVNAFFEYQADPSNLLKDAADEFFPLTLELTSELKL